MGCFTKFFLFALNFVVFALGVAVIVLASLILSHGQEFQTLLSEGVLTVPIVLLALGIIVMIIGFFGCFGALRESPCLLNSYAAIVLVLLIAQIAVAVYGIVEKDEITALISNNMVKVFNKFGSTEEETQSLNVAQNTLKCCGVNNYTDWYTGVLTPEGKPANNGDVPYGCCNTNSTSCNQNIKTLTPEEAGQTIYTEGCYTKFVSMVEGETTWLIVGAVLLGLLQLACVVIACGISNRSPRSHDVY